MKRYFSEEKLNRVARDFDFLIARVNKSYGELDFRLRDGYFNVYYQGNSLAYVRVAKEDYIIRIHKKFLENEVYSQDPRFVGRYISRGENVEYRLTPDELKPFFQQKYLKKIQSNIKRVLSSEEITFEHILITDNLDRPDLILIDRQVTETELKGKRIDLLALRQLRGINYQFVVIEVKLGKNPELRSAVLDQISGYIKHIESHFEDWKQSYQLTYVQLRKLGLLMHMEFEEVVIQRGVKGLIAVGGYSGIATKYIKELSVYLGDIEIRQFANRF